MRIANNIMAMNTHRQYTINNNNISKSAEKLSSGYRVNRAGDDAAGLAISEKMRSQIRGLNMASKNSQDGNSMIQTAEGALQEVHSILQRMNELSVQSATGTNQTLDRNALNAEFQQLKSEIDDISEQTTFNDMNLLDGTFKESYDLTGNYTPGAALSKVVGVNIKQAGSYALIDVAANDGTASDILQITYRPVGGAAADDVTTDIKLNDILNGAKLTNTATDIVIKKDETILVDLTTYGFGSYQYTATADQNGDTLSAAITGALAKALTATSKVDDKALKVQVGAKEGEQMTVAIDDMSSAKLGLTASDIATQDKAGDAISLTRSAINQVSTVRAALGAAQNRLDHKINNLGVATENLQAAESRIRDVDMASEMTQFTKSNILSQAATAMLAQANSLPQNVLQLLR